MENFFTSRMDYVFFVYGLSFFSLSVICFLLLKYSRSQISWQWLGFFAILQGINAWLNSWAISLGDTIHFKDAHLVIMAASFIFLLEFIRSTSFKLKHLPLAKSPERTALVSAVVFLIADLVLSVIDREAFLKFAHFPLQFLMVLAACGISFNIWYFYEMVRAKDHKQKLEIKSYLAWVIAFIFAILVAGNYVCDWYKVKEDMRESNMFLSLAQRTLQTIDFEEIKDLTGSSADLKTSNYQQLKSKLMILHEGMPEIKYLYFIRPVDGNNIVLVDAQAPESKDGFLPGQVISEDPQLIKDVFKSGKPFIESVKDLPPGDALLSGLYPMNDGRTGATIAVLMIDQDVHGYISAMAYERLKIFIMIAMTCAIIFLTFAYLQRYWAFMNQLEGWQNADWFLRWGNAIIIMIAGLGITIGFYGQARQDAYHSFQMIFSERSAGRIEVISKDIHVQINEIKQLKSVLERIPSFDRNTFNYYVRPLLASSPLEGIVWAPRVTKEERADYENRAQLDGIKDFSFKQRDAQGQLVIASQRDEYYPIYYIESLNNNLPAYGFDVATEPDRHSAMQKSCDEGHAVATPPVQLVNKTDNTKSVIVFIPVYRSGTTPRTVEARRRELRGFIETVFHENFLKVIYSAMPAEGLAALVEDPEANPGNRILYRHKIRLGVVNWDKPFIKFALPVDMADRIWRITIIPSTLFISNYLPSGYLLILPFGLLITVLLTLFLNTMVRSRYEAEQLVHRRTSELQEANKSLERTHAELRDSTARMMQSEKFTALGEMAGGIAHELNQPLNVTKIICQSLLNDIRKERFSLDELKNDLPEIVKQMDKMAEIIEHMKAFTSSKDGGEKKEFDINTIIDNAFKFMGAQMTNHGIDVQVEKGDDLSKLFGDPVEIEQAVLNILNNARNAVEASGKEEKKILVRTYLTQGGKSICVQISDNGLGIPEDIREKIYQPFFTTKSALAPDGRPVKGKGLGLSMSRKVVENHGGQIVLESVVGKGATFKIILPIKD